MKQIVRLMGLCCVVGVAALAATGCAAFRSSARPVDVNKAPMRDADYDFADLRMLGNTVADEILRSDFLRRAGEAPIFVVMGVQNRTLQHIDTKALTDTMRTALINSGKVSFVNEARRDDLLKEQGYQLANCTPETRTHIGRQLGARYMLTGSLVEIKKEAPRQVRVSKQEDVYFQLTVEVTDLETSLIAWTTQKERLRSASRPIVGW
jgi:penicillin-binding protein activator